MRIHPFGEPREEWEPSRPGLRLLVPSVQQRRGVVPYLVSAALHGVFLAGLPWILRLVPPSAERPSLTYVAKPIMIRLSNRMVLLQPDSRNVAKDISEHAARIVNQLLKEQRHGVSKAETPPVQSARSSAKPAQAILIQPQYPLDLQPPPESPVLPSALIWSRQTAPIPLEPFITPGPPQRSTERVPASTRTWKVPEPVRSSRALLEAPRLISPPPDLTEPTMAANAHPVALLSVSNALVTAEKVVIPPGNLIPSAPASKGKGGALRGAASSATGQSSAPTASTKKEQPPTLKVATSLPPIAALGELIEANLAPPPPPVHPAGPEPEKAAPGLNHPSNGRFDIVIMQSSAEDSLPSGALGGKPVYTVYLQVGDTADWIMHYCASNSLIVQKGSVVQLPDPRPLNAPYPRLTFRPAEVVTGPSPYVLVHGTIDEGGSLQNLKVIGPVQSDRSSLLAALSKWRFRPATRGESPEKVEIVLAIPVHKS